MSEPLAPRRRLLPAPQRAASILAAAANVFARQGYAATTLDQVAAQARVSKLIVYRHFNSKKELYAAILDEVRHRLETIEQPTAPVHATDGDPAIRQAAAALAATFAVARQLPDAYRLLHRHAPREPDFAGYVNSLVDQERARIEALLSNVADPLVRGWMARQVANAVSTAFLDWLDVGDPARDDEMVERVAYLLAGMVGSLWDRALARDELVGPADEHNPRH
jgi:AcrR family transcriptional regulator